MKKATIIFLQFLFPLLLLAGTEQQSVITEADTAYNAEQYIEAIEKYEMVLSQGFESAELYYNLGNAYFNRNNLPAAILNYERAKVLAPRDADIIFNLSIANSMIPDKIETVPEIFYVRWWKALRNSFNLHSWTISSISIFVLLIISIGIFILSGSIFMRKFAFWAGLVFILANIACLSMTYRKHEIQSKHLEAIVFDPTITIKSSPNKLGKDLFVIHEGTKVFIMEEMNEWANIKIANGSTGWMPLGSVRRI
ncbi:MAG: tetratricopeptide repeat protein [Bacteroidota bacterium]